MPGGIDPSSKKLQPNFRVSDHTAESKSPGRFKQRMAYVNSGTISGYKLIASGADKRIFEPDSQKGVKSRSVIYVPVKKLLGLHSKESALRDEYEKTQDIKKSVPDSSHLAVEMKKLKGAEKIGGQFSLEVQRAEGDLEGVIRKKETTLSQRLDYCEQYLDGLMNLHEGGYVQGDVKPENCLIYEGGNLKIADFGKSEKVEADEFKTYKGNLRFCSPEGRLSHKGDVYGAALVMIRILEELDRVLAEDGSLQEVIIEGLDREPEPDDSKFRGIEKYVVEHKGFLGIGKQDLKGNLTKRLPIQLFRLTRLTPTERIRQQELLADYINALVSKLKDRNHLPDNGSADRLSDLLKKMTVAEPSSRITAKRALDEYRVVRRLIEKRKVSRQQEPGVATGLENRQRVGVNENAIVGDDDKFKKPSLQERKTALISEVRIFIKNSLLVKPSESDLSEKLKDIDGYYYEIESLSTREIYQRGVHLSIIKKLGG